nr:hypothetical protein CFP56_47693 [Quercus suber]
MFRIWEAITSFEGKLNAIDKALSEDYVYPNLKSDDMAKSKGNKGLLVDSNPHMPLEGLELSKSVTSEDKEKLIDSKCTSSSNALPIQEVQFNKIDAEVNSSEGFGWWHLTGIYRNPKTSKRDESWAFLKYLSGRSQLPWMVIGDFNELMGLSEKEDEYWSACSLPMKKSSATKKNWVPPTSLNYKVNVDGAMFSAQKATGVGIVIKDNEGHIIVGLSKKLNLATSYMLPPPSFTLSSPVFPPPHWSILASFLTVPPLHSLAINTDSSSLPPSLCRHSSTSPQTSILPPCLPHLTLIGKRRVFCWAFQVCCGFVFGVLEGLKQW